MRQVWRAASMLTGGCIVANASIAQAGLTFNIIPATGQNAPSQQVIDDVKAAGAFWSSHFANNFTINLTIGVGDLGTQTTGTSNPIRNFYSYSSVRSALVSHKDSADDTTATAHLPAGAAFNLLMNRTGNNPNGDGSATPYLDNNGGANNTIMQLTNANAKALGLYAGDNTVSDGAITFNTNSAITFDYDRSNGISSNAIDFIGIATHEIAHNMGFFSGADVLDKTPKNAQPGEFANDDAFQFVSIMDLYRYSTLSAAQGVLDWTADTRSKFFSIDGGTTSLALLSTGTNYGDTFGDSHWKDNLGIGIMDPTFANGELGVVTARDLQMLDVIGYQAVPEPGALSLLAVGSLCAMRRTRR